MTRDQIKAELRRSACEDAEPSTDVSSDAYFRALLRLGYGEWINDMADDDCRTFFLLVAEALEE